MHEYHATCLTYCTSWGLCWWNSFSFFYLPESGIQNAVGSLKESYWLTLLFRQFWNSLIENPFGRAPMFETETDCLCLVFTNAGSHIGWAKTKNGECAIDRMNWLRPSTQSFGLLWSHRCLPEKESDRSTCFSVRLQVLCVRRVGPVIRYRGGEGDWDVGMSILWTLVSVIYCRDFYIPSLLATVGGLGGMLTTHARGV